jgi:hypothetical protein
MRRFAPVLLATLLLVGCGRIPTAAGPDASAPMTASPSSPSPSPTATPLACAVSPPTSREAPSAAYDSDHQVIVVFGGDTSSGSVAETLQYGGGCWQVSTPSVVPPPRQSAALVYDPDVHKMLLVGGRKDDPKGPQTIPGDVWTWDGNSWSQLPGAPHFGDATAAYDASRHVVVVLGGAPEGTGTWTWDGIHWKYLTGQGPFVRLNPAMCFDSSTNSVLLFGGSGSGVPVLGDTWLWNGSAWAEQHPAHNPPARFEAALACGPRPIMYGGWGDYQGRALADTWTWDGADWQQPNPTRSLGTKPAMFGIFDGSRQLVFAGTNPAEIWSWSGSDWVANS